MSAQAATGPAVWVASYPPARPLSQVLVASCQPVALAEACAQRGVGVWWRLEDHAPAGLERGAATAGAPRAAGPRVESGPGQASRPAAPRPVVRVAPPADTPLGSGGPPPVQDAWAARAWPRGCRACLVARRATWPTPGSGERVVRRLCARRGARRDTPAPGVSGVNTDGWSLPKRRLVRERVAGLGAMAWQDQGKPLHVRRTEMPP